MVVVESCPTICSFTVGPEMMVLRGAFQVAVHFWVTVSVGVSFCCALDRRGETRRMCLALLLLSFLYLRPVRLIQLILCFCCKYALGGSSQWKWHGHFTIVLMKCL